MPKPLNNEQKVYRVSVSTELKKTLEITPNFNMITDGESLVYGYDPETKQQSTQC